MVGLATKEEVQLPTLYVTDTDGDVQMCNVQWHEPFMLTQTRPRDQDLLS
jgi:hypothetical protein